MKIQSIPIFPSIIHVVQCEDFETYQNSLIEWVYNYSKKYPSVEKSNVGGYQSNANFYGDEDFDTYLNKIFYELNSFKQLFNISTFKLKNAWININYPGCYNRSHLHPESEISGVWWIKIPKDSGVIQFESPFEYTQHRLINSYKENVRTSTNMFDSFYLQPVEGTMALFPSDLRHFVDVNKSTEDRISIAFNLDIVS